MHFHIALFIYLSIMVVEAFPIVSGSNDLTEAFVKITKVLDSTQVANCPIGNPTLPLLNTELPSPSRGLDLKFVTIGRGTQNYTCSSKSETATPVSIGALATLFDASCLASYNPTIFGELPSALSNLPVDTLSFFAVLLGQTTPQKTNGLILGKHYFTSTGSPFFDLRIGGYDDWIQAKKNAAVNSPLNATQDVQWLQLSFAEGLGIKEVYRVQTSGGQPPSTCKGMKDSFEVEYAAEYWFYG